MTWPWLTTKLDFLDFTWKMYHTRSGLKEEKTLTKQDTNRSTNQTSNSPPFFSVHSLVLLIRYDTCTLRTTRKRVFREEAAPALKIVYFFLLTHTVAKTNALWSRMQFNHQYSHQFRSPQGGNKFGNSLARDPPYSSCHGTLSERHQDGSLSNESDRMKDFITESNQPGMLVLAWNLDRRGHLKHLISHVWFLFGCP